MIMIGTSGWQYRHWRNRFYPPGVPTGRWLEFYAERFATVELNASFYRLPERATFVDWRERTPADFTFAPKLSRYLTHLRRLRDPAESVARFLDRVDGLGDRLGPVLLQLPPNLTVDPGALDAVLAQFPPEVRVAVEPRHDSWWTASVRAVLERYGAALCWADRHGRPVTPTWRTADFGYLRLHEGLARPRPRYGPAALTSWVRRIDAAFPADEPVYTYFNNDPHGAALVNAAMFAAQCHRHGRATTRVHSQADQPIPLPAASTG